MTTATQNETFNLTGERNRLGLRLSFMDRLVNRAAKVGHGITRKEHDVPCTRCGGSGIWTKFHGTCFRCGGRRVDPQPSFTWHIADDSAEAIAWVAADLAKLEARRIKARARKAVKVADAKAKLEAAFPILSEIAAFRFLASPEFMEVLPGFIFSIEAKARRFGKDLTEKQNSACVNAIAKAKDELAKRRAELESAEDCPAEGRHQISGVVLTLKWVENDFGGSLKMMVKDHRGFKVWGTCPNSISDIEWNDEGEVITESVDKGDTVEFMAAMEQSHDDSKFGFFKRPTKAKITARGKGGDE